MARIIAVTGGIGSGKSVVCEILTVMGYEVYNCDIRAKILIDNSERIIQRIANEISLEAVTEGKLNRQLLAKEVFADEEKLRRLNAITHQAVKDDIERWSATLANESKLFVETAILYQSGLDRMVDEVWEVTAPTELRISRATKRDNSDREKISARIKAQDSFIPEREHPIVHQIANDNIAPLLPQINRLLKEKNLKK